jgi:hypothetical protein
MSKSTSNGGVEEVFILPLNSPNRYLRKQHFHDQQTRLSLWRDVSIASDERVYRMKTDQNVQLAIRARQTLANICCPSNERV